MLNRLTDRTVVLRKDYRSRYSKKMFDYRREVYERKLLSGKPRVIALAEGLKEFLETKEVDLSADDILAGPGQFLDWQYSNPGYYEEIEKLRENRELSEEQQHVLRQVEAGMRMRLYSRYPSGHVIPGYDRLLQTGYDRLIDSVKTALPCAKGERADFFQAALLTLQGAQNNILRYAQTARDLWREQEKAGRNAEQLHRIAVACEKVAHEAPVHFYEAVQLLWLAHEATTAEQICGSLSFGRLDQYLYPFYQKDREEGVLSREEAEEIIQALWIKISGLPKGFQNVTLGGMDMDGKDQCNDLTMMCLEAARLVHTDQPSVALRIHPGTPNEVWEEAMRVIRTGIGFPALFNDHAIIPCMERKGASKEDAYDYGIVGCVEPAVPGKEYGHTEGFRINWVKILELMLHGGTCPITGEHFEFQEKHDLAEFQTFETFYQWLLREFDYVERVGIAYLQMADAQFSRFWPTPYVSSLMKGCIEKGLDVTAGGTLLNLSTINATGMANLVDSLIAIRDGVFEYHWLSMTEFADILRADFDGFETLQSRLCHLPKYGNGIEEVDRIYRELSDRFIDVAKQYENPRGGKYQIGFYSVENHVIMGKLTGATPDGKAACISLANSTSPAQGCESFGPTAVIQSVLKTPMDRLSNGAVLDLKFHPMFFEEPSHVSAVKTLIEVFFRQGGQEIQFNVIDKETLLDARKHPEEYQDLIVRVSGFSAFFVTLDPVTQDEIIARAEYHML